MAYWTDLLVVEDRWLACGWELRVCELDVVCFTLVGGSYTKVNGLLGEDEAIDRWSS